MRRSVETVILIIVLTIGSLLLPSHKIIVNANEGVSSNIVENTSVSEGDGSIGYIKAMPRGMYLQLGYSKINKAGEGKITAGGATFAQVEVEDIGIAVELQKLDGVSWKTVEMWSVNKKNESAIMTSKTFEVESGLYRVTSLHSANSEGSSSTTDLLYLD